MPEAQSDHEPFTTICTPPFLIARFAELQRTLGWTLLHPGFATARQVVWLHIHERDLAGDIDAREFLRAKLENKGMHDALAFMTGRNILRRQLCARRVEDVQATCLATVGLSNGERVGSRQARVERVGTINTLVHISQRLTDGALVEAISIVAEARTVALLDARKSGAVPQVTGTGTDCIVVACPSQGDTASYSGLHTAVGEAIGGAVYEATWEGVEEWDREFMARAGL
jgi:adenosylcobinamide amidohydrolase